MRKFSSYYLFSLLLIGLSIIPNLSQAAFTFDSGGYLQKATGLGTKDPAYIVFNVINTALIFLGSITVIMIVVSGFMWIFAAGAEEKITKAKDLLKGAILGLVIVLGAYGLAQFVFTAIRIATTGS